MPRTPPERLIVPSVPPQATESRWLLHSESPCAIERTLYSAHVITRIRHRGLRLYYRTGDRSRLPQAHVRRITRILLLLDRASHPGQMNISGYRLHPLKGDLDGFWAVNVSRTLRIIFRFEDGNVVDVDLIDYH